MKLVELIDQCLSPKSSENSTASPGEPWLNRGSRGSRDIGELYECWGGGGK